MDLQLGNIWWALILLGLCAGILSGTLGLGSGIILIPAMVILFSFPQKSAQGTALAVMVPMALLGAFRYWHNPQIEISVGAIALIVVGALVGVLVGTELTGRLPAHVLKKGFAVFLIVVAAKMLIFPTRSNCGASAPSRGSEPNGTTKGVDNDADAKLPVE